MNSAGRVSQHGQDPLRTPRPSTMTAEKASVVRLLRRVARLLLPFLVIFGEAHSVAVPEVGASGAPTAAAGARDISLTQLRPRVGSIAGEDGGEEERPCAPPGAT